MSSPSRRARSRTSSLPSTVAEPRVAPSRIALAKLESKLVGELDAHFRLKDRLEPRERTYRHIVIDCRRRSGLMTVNALVAATHLLIPIQSSYFALEGTDDLLETDREGRARPTRTCSILGVVITLHDKRTPLARDIRADRQGVRRQGIRDRHHQERPPGGEPGLQGVDLLLCAPVDRRRRVLQAVRGGHRPCLAPDASVCRKPLRDAARRALCRGADASGGDADRPLVPIDASTQPQSAPPGMGDLSDLMASIAEKGFIEPSSCGSAARGSRSSPASAATRPRSQVGLREIPCVIREVADDEMIEIALIENLQRKDLTPFEEAEALQSLADAVRLHPRGHGAPAREVAARDHRVACAEQHAGGSQKPLSAGRHSLQIIAVCR